MLRGRHAAQSAASMQHRCNKTAGGAVAAAQHREATMPRLQHPSRHRLDTETMVAAKGPHTGRKRWAAGR